jgi:hypothetical protein
LAAEGRTERLREIAAEFVRLKVDVILTYGTQAAEVQREDDRDDRGIRARSTRLAGSVRATHIFCAVQKAGYEPFHPTACQFLGKY